MIEKQCRVLGMRALFRLITRFICAVWDAQCNTEESHKLMIKLKKVAITCSVKINEHGFIRVQWKNP